MASLVLGASLFTHSVEVVAQVERESAKGRPSSQVSHETYSAAQAPSTVRAEATPTLIFTGTSARVTVEAQISQTRVAPSQVVLYRVSGGNKQAIAELRGQNRDGNGTYSTQIILDESRPGAVMLQVEARYPQTYGIAATNLSAGGIQSNLMTVNVLAARQSSGQQPPPSGGQPPVVPNNPGGSGSTWGSFGGALAGSVAGALIGKLFDRHPPSQTQQPPNQPPVQPQTQPTQPKQPVDPAPTETAVHTDGLSIKYPDGWNMSQQILQMGGPIALTNFSSYLRGGIIPNGGAEIEITHVPAGTQSLADTARNELGGNGVPQFVDGQAALRTDYIDEFAPGLTYESVAVYVANGSSLYKFFLSYRAGDPQKEKFVSNFDHVVASARFNN